MDGTALHFTGILHDLKLFEIVINMAGTQASQGSPRQSPRSRERNADPVLTLGGSLDAAPPCWRVGELDGMETRLLTQPPVPRRMGFGCPSTEVWVLCAWCPGVGLLGIVLGPTWCSQCLCSLCKERVFAWRKVLPCSRVELTHN